MQINKVFLCLFLLTIVGTTGCKQQADQENLNEPYQMDWLINRWANTSNKSALTYENWVRGNDTTLYGVSYTVNGKDTVFSEVIKIVYGVGGVYYIPTVKGQNSNKAVVFKLTSVDRGSYIFENAAHDFQQRIIYSKRGKDTLYAAIDGRQKGKYIKEEFLMLKQYNAAEDDQDRKFE